MERTLHTNKRIGKSLFAYQAAFDYMITKGDIAMYSMNNVKNIKETFKRFLNVKVSVKKESENLYIISLNRSYLIGDVITSIEQIVELANEGKAVYVVPWRRTSPAAFLLSWQVRLLYYWIKNKRIYTITKKEENEKQKG